MVYNLQQIKDQNTKKNYNLRQFRTYIKQKNFSARHQTKPFGEQNFFKVCEVLMYNQCVTYSGQQSEADKEASDPVHSIKHLQRLSLTEDTVLQSTWWLSGEWVWVVWRFAVWSLLSLLEKLEGELTAGGVAVHLLRCPWFTWPGTWPRELMPSTPVYICIYVTHD